MISKGILILGALAAAAAGLAFAKKGSAATTTPGVTPGTTSGTIPGTTTTTVPTTPTETTTVPGTTVTTTPGTTIPSSVLPGAGLVPPSDVLAAIVAATGTGDPVAMRKVADQLDQKGWKSQAADLRATADLLERAKAQNILTQVQTTTTTTTPSSNIVDGSNWSQVKTNASTGYTYLQDPSGTQWPVAPGSIKANGAGGYDYTLSDGRVVRNPPKSPTFYTEGGVQPAQTNYVLPDIDGTGWLLDLSQSISTGAAALTSPGGAVYQVTASQITVDTSGNRKVTVPNVGIVKNPTIKAGAVTVPGAEVVIPPVVVPTIPTPVTPIPHGTEDPNAAFAGTLVGQLTGKTTANEPHATILSFQQQEHLQKQDGNYGTETAWQLANVYNIVPPNPLHWGTKTGGYNSLVSDKKAYAAKLLSKGSTDTARADQWKKAAALALKGI